MDGHMVLFCVWILALIVVLCIYIRTGSSTKWNNCAAVLCALVPSVLCMPFAAPLHMYGQGKAAAAAFCALCLCAAVLPFLLFFLVNRHLVRKGEGMFSPLCLPLIAVLIPLCMNGAYYIASLCCLAAFGHP